MAKTPKKEPEDKGIYQQRRGWWYRFSYGGKQHFRNLNTTDKAEAIAKKKYLIETGTLLQPKMVENVWEKAVDAYLDKKIRIGRIREDHRAKTKSALMVFARETGVKSPAEVSRKILQDYYEKRRRTSEAGARSTLGTIQSFLSYLKLLVERVEKVPGSKPESRQTIAPMSHINKWIEDCEDPRLKFVLFCLGNLGMRSGEVRHARVDWFDDEFISIPSKLVYKKKDGTFADWKTKDTDFRQIPLPPKMKVFLAEYLKGKRGLVNPSKISQKRTWDFRVPLDRYFVQVGRSDFYPHAFRHSWITHLMNEGKTIQQVSAWSGDSIQTLERNYWKKKVVAGELDDVIEGTRKKTMAEIIEEAVSAAVKPLMDKLTEKEGEEPNLEEILNEVAKKLTTPDFVKELSKKYSISSVLQTMTDEQREEFLSDND